MHTSANNFIVKLASQMASNKKSLTISHGNAVAERGLSVNTALLSKDRMSFDETTIQALRLVKETIRLHGSPAAVPVT